MQHEDLHQYTEYLFRLALSRCGNLQDAEDLTQETLLAALSCPRAIRDPKSWLTTVLGHKFHDLLRRKYRLPTVSVDVVPEIGDMPMPSDTDDDRPDEEAVRREVAYLAAQYRTVIVRHYLHGEKVDAIAAALGIPKGTVLSRLSTGREQMRKGFSMMDSYEKHSYQPERLEITCSGSSGHHDEPYSLVANDLLKQNILLVAYEQPLTVVEIARALGTPTAFVESCISSLVQSELMRPIGNRFATDFLIYTPDDFTRTTAIVIDLVQREYNKLHTFVSAFLDEIHSVPLRLADGMQAKLDQYFRLHLLIQGLYVALQRIVPDTEDYPLRPDGGSWIAQGVLFPHGFDLTKADYPQYATGGERRAYQENVLGARSIDLHIYDGQPDLNRYQHGPVELRDDELATMLYILDNEIPVAYTGFNPLFFENIPHLVDCGVLTMVNDRPKPAIPILTPAQYQALDNIRLAALPRFADLFEPMLRAILPSLQVSLPAHLEGRVARFRLYPCHALPMAYQKLAVARGDLDLTGANPPMVFVIDDNNVR